jgi:hypothetical protein
MEILAGPAIERRAARTSLGIRAVAPFRGMLAVRDALWAELFTWLGPRGSAGAGPAFLRLNVIDMRGAMDIEAGIITDAEIEGDARVRPGLLPGGEYATLTYRNHSMRANKQLIEWTTGQHRQFDRSDDPAGDRFACRYELNVSDPRREPPKTQWVVQLNFLLRPRQEPAIQGV